MKLEAGKTYMMPLIMGPIYDQGTGIPYPEVEVMALQFQSDREAIQRLLPDCYKVAKEPIVQIMFGYNNGLEFMAGGGYSIATFQVGAQFNGEQDNIEGDYILVMFEDQTVPILGGREQLGVPKLYADISPIKLQKNGHLRCEVSVWGHLVFGIELGTMKKQNAIVRRVASHRINQRPWLAYKYIAALDGPPDADYPTITRNDTKVEELWLSDSGSVYFGNAGESDIGKGKYLLDALKTLPFIKFVQAVRFRGSSILRYDLSRRLR